MDGTASIALRLASLQPPQLDCCSGVAIPAGEGRPSEPAEAVLAAARVVVGGPLATHGRLMRVEGSYSAGNAPGTFSDRS